MISLLPLSAYDVEVAKVLLGRLDELVQALAAEGEPNPVGVLRGALALDVAELAQVPLLYAHYVPTPVLWVAPRLHRLLVGLDFAGVDLPWLSRKALDIISVFEPGAA